MQEAREGRPGIAPRKAELPAIISAERICDRAIALRGRKAPQHDMVTGPVTPDADFRELQQGQTAMPIDNVADLIAGKH